MHGTIQKGLRYGAALVLAMALCATAALAAGTEGKRLVPVGHTVGVKLFARGVVVVKLPEGGTPARTCGLKTGDVIVECGGEAVTSTEQFQSLLQKNGTDATALEIKRQGRFDVERARDQEIPQKYWSRLQNGETVESEMGILTPDMVLGPQRKGIKLTYTTDTRPTDSIRENAKDSDLFICEGMYGEKEKAAKAVEYKHMTFYEAAELAKEANVGEMWLTHYSPSLTKPEEYMDDVKAIFPNSIAAKDKRSVELVFED